jgi:DNA-binding transcriptional LysR family regulator
MKPTLRQLEAFAQVARQKSFARAAEAVGMSQPALSQTIAQMERLLETKLFQRTTRSVRLTDEGELLLPRAEAILAAVAEATGALRERVLRRRARIAIGSLPSLADGLLPLVLRRYRASHPEAQVAVTDGTSLSLYDAVESGALDLAIASRLRDRQGVLFQPLLRERFALVLRQDHPLAARRSVTWREALGHDFIAFPHGSAGRSVIQAGLERAGLTLDPGITMAQSSSALGMVVAGLGVAALPAAGCPSPDHPVLASRPLVEPVIDREVGLLRAAERAPTSAMLAMQALVFEVVAGQRQPGLVRAPRPGPQAVRPENPGAKPTTSQPPISSSPSMPSTRRPQKPNSAPSSARMRRPN